MTYPRFQLARQFKKVRYTGGNITLNSTAVSTVSTALDMTLDAQIGDMLEYGIDSLVGNAAVTTGFDVYTLVSSSPVNPFGAGLDASFATLSGTIKWTSPASQYTYIGGSMLYTVVAGDLDTNNRVTARLRYVQTSSTSKTMYAISSTPLTVWVKNLGPSDDD